MLVALAYAVSSTSILSLFIHYFLLHYPLLPFLIISLLGRGPSPLSLLSSSISPLSLSCLNPSSPPLFISFFHPSLTPTRKQFQFFFLAPEEATISSPLSYPYCSYPLNVVSFSLPLFFLHNKKTMHVQ